MPKTADGQSVAELSRAFQAELQRIQPSLSYNDSWIRPTGNPDSNDNVLQVLFNLAEVAATKANTGGWVGITWECGLDISKFKSWEEGLHISRRDYAPEITDTTSYCIAMAVRGYLAGLLGSDIVTRVPKSVNVLQGALASVNTKISAVDEANANYVSELNGIENTLLMVSRSYNSDINILNVALRAATDELDNIPRPPHMSPESEAALTRLSELRTSVQDSINVLSRPASAPVAGWRQALAEYSESSAQVERSKAVFDNVVADASDHSDQLYARQISLRNSESAEEPDEFIILNLRQQVSEMEKAIQAISLPSSDLQQRLNAAQIEYARSLVLNGTNESRLNHSLEVEFHPASGALVGKQMEYITRINNINMGIDALQIDPRQSLVELRELRIRALTLQDNMQTANRLFSSEAEGEGLSHLTNLHSHATGVLKDNLNLIINSLRELSQEQVSPRREQAQKRTAHLQHELSNLNRLISMHNVKNNFFGDATTGIGGCFDLYLSQRNSSFYGFFNDQGRSAYIAELQHLMSAAITNQGQIGALMAKIVQGLETFKPRTAASTDSLFHQLVQFKSALEAAAGVGAEAGAEKMTEPPVRRRM